MYRPHESILQSLGRMPMFLPELPANAQRTQQVLNDLIREQNRVDIPQALWEARITTQSATVVATLPADVTQETPQCQEQTRSRYQHPGFDSSGGVSRLTWHGLRAVSGEPFRAQPPRHLPAVVCFVPGSCPSRCHRIGTEWISGRREYAAES